MKKRVLTLALTLAMLLGLLPGFAAQTAQAADGPSGKWTSEVTTSHSKNVSITTYNEETCYEIKTAEDLAWFAKMVQNARADAAILSANIVLAADIDLSAHYWTPIYRYTGEEPIQMRYQSMYTGNIYGNNHTISGLYLAPLSVDYTFTSANNIYSAKAGDIYHNEQYGFVVTKGSVKGIKFDGVFLDRQIAGLGKIAGQSGNKTVISDSYSLIFVSAEGAIKNVELANAEISTKLNANDYNYIFSIGDGAATESGVYIHDSSFTSTGNGQTLLIDAYMKSVRNCVVLAELECENKVYSGVWGADPAGTSGQPTLTNCYTDIYLDQFEYEKQGESKPESWFTPENISGALGRGWSIVDGELVLGTYKEKHDVWTDYAATTEPETTRYNGKTCYAIGTAEELAWLANEVQNGRHLDANAVLTANIDLGAHEWTPIYIFSHDLPQQFAYHSAYAGDFYGDYHTIANLKLAPLSVDYIFASDNKSFDAKAGDIYHNDEYGFINTKGVVQGLKLDTITLERAAQGLGKMLENAGNNDVICDLYSVDIVDAGTKVKDIEIENLAIDVNLGIYDMALICGTDDKGGYENVYIHDGYVHNSGKGTAILIDGYCKPITNAIVTIDFDGGESKWSAVFNADPVETNNNMELIDCYTNIDYETLKLCDYQGEIMSDDWFTDEHIYNVLTGTDSTAWTLVNGKLVFGDGAPVNLTGDVDGDGKVELLDFTLLRSILAEGGTVEEYPNADVNADGTIGIQDVLLLWNILSAQG